MIEIVHRGKQGDLIYSLAAIKGLAEKSGDKIIVHLRNNGLDFFDLPRRRNVAPIVEAQPYVHSVTVDGEHASPEIDFEDWLIDGHGAGSNIAASACHFADVSDEFAKKPWLHLSAPASDLVLFSRTGHYPAIEGERFWRDARGRHQNAQFIGLDREHIEYERLFGPIRRFATATLMNAASAIASCKHLVTDQSPQLAIAHGLQKSVTVSVAREHRDCIFLRHSAEYPFVEEAILREYGVVCI